jgi:hypothetical protein
MKKIIISLFFLLFSTSGYCNIDGTKKTIEKVGEKVGKETILLINFIKVFINGIKNGLKEQKK